MRLKRCICAAALGWLLLATLIGAEYKGQVTFNNLPLPGAIVTASQGEKTVTAVSDAQGAYLFPDLAEGAWSMHAEKPGFGPLKKDVAVGVGLPGAAFEMTMLPLEEMGAVAASGPAPATVTSARPAAAVPASPVPAPATAAPAPAATATPATTTRGAGSAKTPAAPATGFQRTDLNATANAPDLSAEAAGPAPGSDLSQRAADGFLINGSANNANASPFGQSAAFGNNRRSGFHLYTYALSLVDTNSALDARSYSLTGQNTPKPAFNNMTGTFSLGGPLKIPHIIDRNGPQMTLNYSRTENRSPSVLTGLMPTAAERSGDFSQAEAGNPAAIYLPGNPSPQDKLTSISPQAQQLLQYYPQPNFTGSSVYNYQVAVVGNTHTDNVNLRLSRNFMRRNFVSGLLAVSDTRGDSSNIFNFLDLRRSLGINSNISYRRMSGQRYSGTFTYSYSRNSNQALPYFSNRVNVSGAAGIAGNDQSPLYWGPPSLQFNQSQISGLNDGAASVSHNQTNAMAYVGTWSHGRHNLTFGGDFRWQQFNTISESNPRGAFTFTGAATGLTGTATASGFDFADFLLGAPDAAAIAFGNADKYLRAKQPDLYASDDWRVAPGLTLNLGLRWEYASPPTEKYGRLVNLDVGPGFAAIAPVEATGPNALKGTLSGMTYPNSLIRPYYHEIEPRLAFAWRPWPASSLVLRGGYGISYNTGVYQPLVNQMVQQSPLSDAFSVASSAAQPLTLAKFPLPTSATTPTFAVDPNLKVGYVQAWNFQVAKDLPFALQMVAAYSANKGTHQFQAFAPNTYPEGAIGPSGFTYYTAGANSERQAGILQLRRRLHNGFTAQAQYTYSKSIDDASTLGGGGMGGVAQNWLNLTGERGPSSFDQRHLLNLTLQYTSGMGVNGGTLLSGWRGAVAKDWTFMDMINLGTGLPLTPIYASLAPGTGINGTVRADYTGLPLYAAPAGYFLNPAAVAAPLPGQWGNAGVDSMRAPAQFSMSASMQRSFRLNDRFTLSTRIDANNPLNHVAVTGINTTVTSRQFGWPSAVNGMRTVSTTLRLTF